MLIIIPARVPPILLEAVSMAALRKPHIDAVNGGANVARIGL